MTTAGQAIDGVLARLAEAEHAKIKRLADDIAQHMPGHWLGDRPTAGDADALFDLAAKLHDLGYRKAATP